MTAHTESFVVKIIDIEHVDNGEKFLGTGFLVTANLVMTCCHVVGYGRSERGFDDLRVRVDDETKIKVSALFTDEKRDLALILLKENVAEPTIHLVQGVHPQHFDIIEQAKYFIAGFAAPDGDYTEWKRFGVRGIAGDGTNEVHWQFDAGIHEGMSGSPWLVPGVGGCYCAGMAYLGGEGKPSSCIVTSDKIIAFAKNHGLEANLAVRKAADVFRGGRTIRTRLPIFAIALFVVFVLAGWWFIGDQEKPKFSFVDDKGLGLGDSLGNLLGHLVERETGVRYSRTEAGFRVEVTYSGEIRPTVVPNSYNYPGGKVMIFVDDRQCHRLEISIQPYGGFGVDKSRVQEHLRRSVLEACVQNRVLLVEAIAGCVSGSL